MAGTPVRAVLAVAAGVLAGATDAATYYLAPSGTDADGRGASASAPWKTITYATGRMGAGDTVLLAGGTYAAETRVVVNNGGSSTAPMVIRAQTGARPVIDLGYLKPVSGLPAADPADTLRLAAGQAGRTGSENQNRCVSIGVSNVVIEGLTIQGGHTAIWGASWSGTKSGLQLRDCTIRYHEQYALRLDNYDDVRIEGCDVYHCGLVNWPRGSSGWPHAIIGWNAHRVVVKDCRVHDNHGEGVGPFQGCGFWEVRNCEVFDNWSVNIYIDLDESDCVVDANLVYNTGRYGTSGRNMPDAVRIANEIADMDYSAWGIAQDPTPQVANVTVTNNICINTGGGICAFPYAPYNRFSLSNSLIANNTIVRVPTGFSGIWVHGDNVEVANNLIVSSATPTSFTNVGAGVSSHHNLVGSDGGFVTGTGYVADSYKLKQTSAAVNAGATLGEVTADYWGTRRPQGAGYDVGACEFAAATRICDGMRGAAGGPVGLSLSRFTLGGRRMQDGGSWSVARPGVRPVPESGSRTMGSASH